LTSYGNSYYNQSGRGYPDVSAVGLNILLYFDTQPAFVGGTSASAPIFASIINLINENRLAAGKSTVGFINPTLYKNPHAFTDVSYLAAVVYAFTNKTDYYGKQPRLQHQWLQRCEGLGSSYGSMHSKVL
jgi:subtilase family serine protease